MNNRN